MSHSVTVTRMTTTSTSTAIIVNTGFLKTASGLLKLFETIIAAICLFLAFYFQFDRTLSYKISVYEFFICVMACALITSGCLLLACIFSLSTSTILTKTLFELIYHSVLFALCLAASITLFIETKDTRYGNSDKMMTAAVLGLILSILYLVSTVFAFRTYRGL
ncbi:unnamed protein product [Nesidiocoris tenuis]|uniref:MARVEL domain-containing protein n=1 Tax=Nesidiocoris tenuis TaxID=355587 RepID=A0A6H5GCN6_9HEMI|nr:unnamed protein product [Nesidiocoris tenuis]